jgi:hypothetical protein
VGKDADFEAAAAVNVLASDFRALPKEKAGVAEAVEPPNLKTSAAGAELADGGAPKENVF